MRILLAALASLAAMAVIVLAMGALGGVGPRELGVAALIAVAAGFGAFWGLGHKNHA